MMIIYFLAILIIAAGLIVLPSSQLLPTILAQEDLMTESTTGNTTESTTGNTTESTTGNTTESTTGNTTESEEKDLQQFGSISRKRMS
jgi:hypothetical protein